MCLASIVCFASPGRGSCHIAKSSNHLLASVGTRHRACLGDTQGSTCGSTRGSARAAEGSPSFKIPAKIASGEIVSSKRLEHEEPLSLSRRLLLAMLGVLPAVLAAERPAASAIVDEQATARVFDSAAASVVSVVNKRRQGDSAVQDSVGSGIIWDERGYIVTNYHCIQPVMQDQTNKLYTVVIVGEAGGKPKEFAAIIQSSDTSHDLAVLKIDALPGVLKPIKVGRSADLRVGQSAYSIGSPYGLSKTFTSGVISGLNRGIPTPAGTIATGAIQTDASINSGNSGGPLLDSGGRLIGVSTATYSSNKSMGRGSGVNFAIAVDTLLRVVPRLIVYGNASGKGV